MKKSVLIALGAILCVPQAIAQNQQLSVARQIVENISASEMVALLQSAGLSARFTNEDNGSQFIEASANGAFVYVALRDCSGSGANVRCGTIQPFGFFNSSGVMLSQTNTYNIQQSRIAVAGLNNDGRGIIATKIYLQGGVTQDNLKFQMGLFFLDLDTLISAITPGTIAQIAYKNRPGETFAAAGLDKIINDRFAAGDGWKVNRVGAHAPSLMTPGVLALLERN